MNSSGIKPEGGTPVKPNGGTPIKPEGGTPVKPKGGTPIKPYPNYCLVGAGVIYRISISVVGARGQDDGS